MKNSNHGKKIWPIITLSTVGLAGAIALAARMNRKNRSAPLEKAADLIGQVTQETKEKIDTIVHEVQSHLSGDESAGLSGLAGLATEFKEKLDAMTEHMKGKIRSIRSANGTTKTAEVHETAKS